MFTKGDWPVTIRHFLLHRETCRATTLQPPYQAAHPRFERELTGSKPVVLTVTLAGNKSCSYVTVQSPMARCIGLTQQLGCQPACQRASIGNRTQTYSLRASRAAIITTEANADRKQSNQSKSPGREPPSSMLIELLDSGDFQNT